MSGAQDGKAPIERVLVIKHGALGDIFMSLPPMKAIREHYPDAEITLLTTKSYASLLGEAPYFDELWIDSKPKVWQLRELSVLRSLLKSKPFNYVYDLQTSGRSSSYYTLMGKPKHWSGIAKGCSHNTDSQERPHQHTAIRQQNQLKQCGITYDYIQDVSWLSSDLKDVPRVPTLYALIIAGGSAHRPEKRWPKEKFTDLCNSLIAKAITPVLIGTDAEREELNYIEDNADGCINLCGKTNLFDIIQLAKDAQFAIGNDTGPMHMVAATQCRSIVLFSAASNPALCAPQGNHVTVLQKENLEELSASDVKEALDITHSTATQSV